MQKIKVSRIVETGYTLISAQKHYRKFAQRVL